MPNRRNCREGSQLSLIKDSALWTEFPWHCGSTAWQVTGQINQLEGIYPLAKLEISLVTTLSYFVLLCVRINYGLSKLDATGSGR